MESVRQFWSPAVLALLTTLLFDQLSRRRGLLPPGFGGGVQSVSGASKLVIVRRSLALTSLWGVLWIGVFFPLAALGQATELDLSSVSTPQLFLLHLLFVVEVE